MTEYEKQKKRMELLNEVVRVHCIRKKITLERFAKNIGISTDHLRKVMRRLDKFLGVKNETLKAIMKPLDLTRKEVEIILGITIPEKKDGAA